MCLIVLHVIVGVSVETWMQSGWVCESGIEGGEHGVADYSLAAPKEEQERPTEALHAWTSRWRALWQRGFPRPAASAGTPRPTLHPEQSTTLAAAQPVAWIPLSRHSWCRMGVVLAGTAHMSGTPWSYFLGGSGGRGGRGGGLLRSVNKIPAQ